MAERHEQPTDAPQDSMRADEQNESNPPSPRKKRTIRIVLIIILGIVLVGGLLWFIQYRSVGRFMQNTDDAYIQADAVIVSPKVAGYVERVFVADNQQVRAGQPLLQIDPGDYRARAEQFQAQIDVAEANAEGVRAQIREQGAAIERAQAELGAARTRANFANAEVARYRPLAASGAESRERLAQLENEARQANAQVASAEAALSSARRRVGTLTAQVSQALSQGNAARAQLASAESDVGSTLIRASIDGRIGDKTVRVGQYLQPATRTMSIVPTRQLYVEANFKETQLGLMRVGQPVRLEVDALPGVEIHGRVESVSPGTGAQFSVLPPQNATGNFTKIVQRVPVRIAIDAGPETLKLLVPGMSVSPTVDTRSARDARDRIKKEQERYNEQRGHD
ncbi:HlyD family secretion protein [Sphingomonas desiccabilis]|uniref:HlyD family secretion protein n=1 Tax=Sphingomonas desiccabilis TaxID=429134 RepID=A0A4Q2J1A1_9SPHN|nr:HlyD family secretion protein [Sphingomonas desiccabilis]MBB3910702.1 membrane fusion protein (multidrug efflux system) [Sphingomonas desiccabilis]RXZ35321.1 HlyD family secretion protein [Sphingomonas desiccabilis]